MPVAHMGTFQAGYFIGYCLLGAGDNVAMREAAAWLVYSTLLQSGVDRICLDVATDVAPELFLPSLSDRVQHEMIHDTTTIDHAVEDAFSAVGIDHLVAMRNRDITAIISFVADVIYAAKAGTHLIWLSPLPTPQMVQGCLPPELYVPINNLLALMQRQEPQVITPRYELRRRDVAIFDEIMSSAPFAQYSQRHQLLANADESVTGAVAAVTATAAQLSRLHRTVLKHQAALTTLITATAKCIDLLGKLPGTLADLIASALTRRMEARSRIVIYELDDLVELQLQARLSQKHRQTT